MHSDQIKRLRRLTLTCYPALTFIMSGPLYERRAHLESRAPLTLVTTLEIDDIPTVEFMITFDDMTFKKVMVPTHDLESLEQVLYCYHEFLEAARKLNLDKCQMV